MHERNKEVQVYIGKRISERRKKLGLNLANIAMDVGVTMQQIQKYETALSKMSASTLHMISHVLGVELDYFFKGFSEFEKMKLPMQHTVVAQDLTRALNVLLIEDDAGDTYLTRRAFEASAIDVNMLALHDSRDVFVFLRNQTTMVHFPMPDLIVLDLNLPRQNGVSILRDLKRDRTLSDIPVVILTNSINVKDMVMCYQEHAAGYMCKSFDYAEFEQRIDTLARYWYHALIVPSRQHETLACSVVDR